MLGTWLARRAGLLQEEQTQPVRYRVGLVPHAVASVLRSISPVGRSAKAGRVERVSIAKAKSSDLHADHSRDDLVRRVDDCASGGDVCAATPAEDVVGHCDEGFALWGNMCQAIGQVCMRSEGIVSPGFQIAEEW